MSDEVTIKPGYKTTEFWLSTVAAIVGAVLASGLAEDSIVMRVAGVAALVLSAMGYSVARGAAKKIMLLMLAFIIMGAVGCCKGHISADAIAPAVEAVTERHDKLLVGELDPTKVSDEDKATYLRTAAMLRAVVERARQQED